MPVWKSFANRRDSFTFFAVEQGKTRENVDCSWRGDKLGQGIGAFRAPTSSIVIAFSL